MLSLLSTETILNINTVISKVPTLNESNHRLIEPPSIVNECYIASGVMHARVNFFIVSH